MRLRPPPMKSKCYAVFFVMTLIIRMDAGNYAGNNWQISAVVPGANKLSANRRRRGPVRSGFRYFGFRIILTIRSRYLNLCSFS
jgi:hypothetical protein